MVEATPDEGFFGAQEGFGRSGRAYEADDGGDVRVGRKFGDDVGSKGTGGASDDLGVLVEFSVTDAD